MWSSSPSQHLQTKSAIALALTLAAGFVDIVGYISLHNVFTAHMTGETVHLAQNLLQRDWFEAAAAGCVIGAFLLGSIVGRTIIEIGWRTGTRTIASATLLLELILIALVVPFAEIHPDGGSTLALLALLAAAMGVQTATLTRIGSLTVHTTFVTGMLNKLAQLLSQAVFLNHDIHHGHDMRAERRKVGREARFIFSVWFCYLAGAALGTLMNSLWGPRVLLLPVCIVTSAAFVDQARPLSIEEEQDQP
jgi:uncharacterized membrane protein YoaK (UPF0700 family)